MADKEGSNDSQAHPSKNDDHPRQGFDHLLEDYGMMLIQCSYDVCTMPSCCTIHVLFLNKLDMISYTNTALFMYDSSMIYIDTMHVQCTYNFTIF